MKRKLSIILCVICFTLLLPLGFLWLNSLGFADEIEVVAHSPKHEITMRGIGCTNGLLFIGQLKINSDSPMTTQPAVLEDLMPGWRFRHQQVAASLTYSRSIIGFGYWDQVLPRARSTGISLPCWFVALLLLIFPGLYIRSIYIRRNRVRNNLCISCGYDLRESHERCPECGLLIAGNPA